MSEPFRINASFNESGENTSMSDYKEILVAKQEAAEETVKSLEGLSVKEIFEKAVIFQRQYHEILMKRAAYNELHYGELQMKKEAAGENRLEHEMQETIEDVPQTDLIAAGVRRSIAVKEFAKGLTDAQLGKLKKDVEKKVVDEGFELPDWYYDEPDPNYEYRDGENGGDFYERKRSDYVAGLVVKGILKLE